MSNEKPDLSDLFMRAMEEKEEMRKLIASFLVGSALADHLGDIRNIEVDLYMALGVSREELKEARWEAGFAPTPLDVLKYLAKKHDIPLKDYVWE